MATLAYLEMEHDERRNLVHVSFNRKVTIDTEEKIREFFSLSKQLYEQMGVPKPFYMVINITNIIIDPSLYSLYADLAGDILENYLHPNGVARYGHQITRLTVRRGYSEKIHTDPNIFATRQEATAYIDGLIASRTLVGINSRNYT